MALYKNYIMDKRRSQTLFSKEERDVCLVESLNRYIGALGDRIDCLQKIVKEQSETTVIPNSRIIRGLDRNGE
jgi:hypothetical protein